MRKTAWVVSAVALALLVAGSLWYERYQPFVACLALLALVVLVRAAGWWPRRRGLVLTLGFDIALIFLYLWSLDERVHIVIQVTTSGYVATIEGHTATWRRSAVAGTIGLTAGSESTYHTGVTVGGLTLNPHAWHATSPLARFMEWMRFAAPRPAWANVTITIPGHAPIAYPLAFHRDGPPRSWSVNTRGELEANLGSFTVLPILPGTSFVLQADLMRPDATQGILLSVTHTGHAELFQVAFDGPGARWAAWNDGTIQSSGRETGPWFDVVGLIQHNLRLFLSNVVASLLLLPSSILLFLVLAALDDWGISRKNRTKRVNLRANPRTLDVIAIATALCAAAAAALVADNVFERVPHIVDSVAYVFQAKMLAAGRLSIPVPRYPRFFQLPDMVAHDGKWFGKYPPGWPLTLAIGMALGIPWLVNPILTGANVLLVYLIGWEAYDRTVGLVAAVLALSSPFLLALGGEYMSHTVEISYLGVFAYLLLRWRRRRNRAVSRPPPEWPLLVPAGVALGMAAITRSLDAVAFSWPLLVLLVRRPLGASARPLFWVALGALAPVVFELVYNALLTGSAFLTPFTLLHPNDHPGFGVHEGLVGNFTLGEGLWNTVTRTEDLLAGFLGWPFYLTLALAALPFLLGHARLTDVVLGLSSLSIMLAYVSYFSTGESYDPRYWAAAAPGILLLSARGFQTLYELLLSLPRCGRPSLSAAGAVPCALGAFLLTCNALVYLPAQLPLYRGYYGGSATFIRPLERVHLHNAVVFVKSLGTSPYLISRSSSPYAVWLPLLLNSATLDGDVVYAKHLGSADRRLMRLYPHREYYLLDRDVLARLVVTP